MPSFSDRPSGTAASGAISSTIPRFVFDETTVRVAVIDSKIARPTPNSAARASTGDAASAERTKSSYVRSGKDARGCTFPGFAAEASNTHAERIASASDVGDENSLSDLAIMPPHGIAVAAALQRRCEPLSEKLPSTFRILPLNFSPSDSASRDSHLKERSVHAAGFVGVLLASASAVLSE